MSYLAHSAKGDVPEQSYLKHVTEVSELLKSYVKELAPYTKYEKLLNAVGQRGAEYHDLGKLGEANQEMLHRKDCHKSLPVHHQDAGVAYFLQEENLCVLAAALIAAHHGGFPDFPEESNRGQYIFRDKTAYDSVERELEQMISTHQQIISSSLPELCTDDFGDKPVFLRMLLSCLADADHTDTARNYRKYPDKEEKIRLKPRERLDALDRYVAELQRKNGADERGQLRQRMYESCRNAQIDASISSCDSPVGTGKTTSIMAHLLAQAERRGLRRIIVVLPFTNIIRQSVQTYRNALALPGENPEAVVAELHHRADIETEELRHLTPLWRAPIIVTTAVAFFETLASDTPATLRRLHELPGSAIFVDESHAALPVHLLPIAWKWMNVYADEWNCYWVLASGSLNRFWNIPKLAGDCHREVPEIVEEDIRTSLSEYEDGRVTHCWDLAPKGSLELAMWVQEHPGPKLLIVNTIQSAAAIAHRIKQEFGRECVEHLSTALTAADRELTLERVRSRLNDSTDTNWTLVATSCVEAGVDFSFRTGFREISSLTSLIQASGRINRNGEYAESEMWSFRLREVEPLKANPQVENASQVLMGYLKKAIVPTASLSTQAMEDEISLYGMKNIKKFLENENNCSFKQIEKDFQVITSNTRLAIVDGKMKQMLQSGYVDWKLLQKHSVQISTYNLEKWHAEQLTEDIYVWKMPYSQFLGYMEGVVCEGDALFF
jgi:CRISPR-associated endonuclease Cas3-HD